MISKITAFLEKQGDIVPLLLRLVIGATMAGHGYGKVFGGNFSAVAEQIAGGFGLPVFFGYLVGIGEFFGGLGLIAGILTRFSAGSIGLIMLGAIYVHAVMQGQGFLMSEGKGWEWQALLLAGSLCLVILGSGRYGADPFVSRMLFRKAHPEG